MKLTNAIRKQIVANMVTGIFEQKISEFEKEMASYTRETVLSELKADINWYKDVPEKQKRLIPAYSTFVIAVKPNATDENKYPDTISMQPEIRIDVKTNDKKTDKNNLILKVGKYNSGAWLSDVKKLPVGQVIPAPSQSIILYFDKSQKSEPCQKFFDLRTKKIKIQVEIQTFGINAYNALVSCSTLEKAIETMPNIKKYLPEDLATKPKAQIVPKELYDNINKFIAA